MTDTAAGALLELHHTGQLVARYPEVRGLLAEHSPAELTRAGQLLARLDPDEVLTHHPATPVLSVAITGHGTLSALVPPLTAELARHGVLLRPYVSDFDSWVFDLGDPHSDLRTRAAQLVLCVLDPAVVFDELPVPWRVDNVAHVLAEKVALVERLAAGFTGGTLVVNTMPLPRQHTAQLVDHRSRAALGAAWRRANAKLLDLPAHPSVAVIDLDPLVADGIPVTDTRLSTYAKAHLSPDLLAAYAREVAHLGRNILGLTKKCLVLDLDGTLWGGVLGEDGAEGIEVRDGFRGEAFQAFQRVVKQLGAQGVLLAAVSKNDPEPVRAVLGTHPGMTVREDDFVRVVANWRPKHENLLELAQTLNLGTDSMVFVDDSAYECGLVRRELPDVAVVRLDGEPARHPGNLLRDGWFDTRELTTTDRHRVARYREDLVRADFLATFDSLEEYLRELGVTVRLARAEPRDVARVSQLSLRTNQFNLTTRRLQPADVRELLDDPAALVLVIHAADRFGDNGAVGAILATRVARTLRIDNFLLSCRVFSRGIEQTCLHAVLARARAEGMTAVLGEYRPTAKNARVAEFYPRNGFTPAGEGTFGHDLADIAPAPAHVRLTEDWSVPRAQLTPDGAFDS